MFLPSFDIEDGLSGVVAGIDEAGRGPWAGPVIAACVVLDRGAPCLHMIDDSKKLSDTRRREIYRCLMECDGGSIGIGQANAREIDEINILQATMLAMRRAYEDMERAVDFALIDGNKAPDIPTRTRTVIKGDSKSLSIAAASIIAKVTRDDIMCALHEECPQYGFAGNKGYGTKQHRDALMEHGRTVHHRYSYKPVRRVATPR